MMYYSGHKFLCTNSTEMEQHCSHMRLVVQLLDRDICDPDVLKWLICFVDSHILYVMHDLETVSYTAKYCMFVIQPRCRNDCDEELGAICPRPGIGHRKRVGSKKMSD
jgi:hypothetical protein